MEHVNTGMIQKVNKEKKAMNKIVLQTITNTSFELLQITGIEFYWIRLPLQGLPPSDK